MKLRKIRLSDDEMNILTDYVKTLGYEIQGTDGLFVIKDPETRKRVFLQRQDHKLVAVSDESLLIDSRTMESMEFEMVEDLNSNLWLFNMLKHPRNHPVRQGVDIFKKIVKKPTMREFMREFVGIVGLEFNQIR